MNQKPYRTNYWVWALATSIAFVALGFFDPRAVEVWNSNSSFWGYVGNLLRGKYDRSPEGMVARIVLEALQLAPNGFSGVRG
jgi:hypothetical protein